jgi:hypothetical protein
MEMREKIWVVSYVSWDEYKAAICPGAGLLWDKFEKADLVFGGINFSADFL